QVGHGAITGVLADTTGAVIPGAAVTIVRQQTGVTYSVLSQADGVYLAPQLLAGEYSVSVQAPGFKKLTVDGLKVDVGRTVTQSLVLEIGQITEAVEVLGHANLVETTTGQLGSTVAINHVLEMPIQDRNVFSLLNLVPGSWFRPFTENPANAFFADY